MLRSIAASTAVLALCTTLALATAPKKVHVAAGVDAPEDEADRYLQANLTLVQKDVPQAIRTCAKSVDPALVADFEFAVEVGKGGRPTKTLPTPANPFTSCVAKAVGAMRFSEPLRPPLGVYFEVAIRE